jgi:hypothetical protein
MPHLPYNQCVINENQQKYEAPGKGNGFFFLSFFSFSLSVMLNNGFQHINSLIILNYKKIIGIFYYTEAEKPEK